MAIHEKTGYILELFFFMKSKRNLFLGAMKFSITPGSSTNTFKNRLFLTISQMLLSSAFPLSAKHSPSGLPIDCTPVTDPSTPGSCTKAED